MSKTPSSKASNTEEQKKLVKLSPEVNKIIYVRNLPYKITA